MLNELKKESLKKVLAWVVLWAVVAVGCFVYPCRACLPCGAAQKS